MLAAGVGIGPSFHVDRNMYLLDQLPGAIAGWSYRVLTEATVGESIGILRRGSDNDLETFRVDLPEANGIGDWISDDFSSVSAWLADDSASAGYGTQAYDQINSYHLQQGVTASQPEYTSTGFDCDGTDDFFGIAASPFFSESATSMSIVLQYRTSNTTFNGGVGLITESAGFAATAGGFLIAVDDRGGAYPTNGLTIEVGTTSATPPYSVAVGVSDIIGSSEETHHTVITYENGTIKVYHNGTDVSGSIFFRSAQHGVFKPKNSPLALGSATGGIVPFNGLVREYILFNRVLTPAEAEFIYAHTPA